MRQPRHMKPRIDVSAIGAAGEILAIVAPGFQAGDLHAATGRAQREGFAVRVASTVDSLVEGEGDRGDTLSFVVDAKPAEADPKDYVGLVIPGGERHIGALTAEPKVEALVRSFVEAGKPVLGWGEGVQLLASFSPEPETIRSSYAALALGGEIYPTQTEEGREDAADIFLKTLTMNQEKVAS